MIVDPTFVVVNEKDQPVSLCAGVKLYLHIQQEMKQDGPI